MLHLQPSDDDVLAVFAGTDGSLEESDDGIILLKPAIKDGDNTVDRLTLRQPTVAQVLGAADVIGKRPTLETVYDSQIILIAKSCGLAQKIIDALPSRILDEAVAWVSAFEEDARRSPEAEPDWSPEFVVNFPNALTGGGRSFSVMRLREPTVAERRKFKARESGGSAADILRAEISLVQDVSGWHTAAVLNAPISLFARAADYLTGFFIVGPATGKASRRI
ncbi:hypothetical protein AA23498_1362 [Acetobacter nitrogenifigens DSM 23921 = NBRC 105050]|uniref:Uncharacterized protein n=1 Tax=Acetobacter nitrogenifigens DSM 23921 = NBRC 105050 TaxID=1120919 RepID=A0A511X5D9_9PROT|nr:phage tail assembly protein [Acetobacter nitrogenifigens]GBQ92087.1 hypothetical protein AA23498_1362 [Acetobacter nitrogenifigens DSM 23921 = NBRC 105050]GEN58130.1 hypothetical protein ANI02nite_00140 [Acetobacter nitrogenifigens DSM 23921 = NBRC 105050]